MEYNTKYPKTLVLKTGIHEAVRTNSDGGVQQLHIRVDEKFDVLYGMFVQEGFTRVNFEHKQPLQLGHGMSLKLASPWEMHIRLSKSGNAILIHAEVEVSRDYMQHLFSQRTPVIYEMLRILDRHDIKYVIYNTHTDGQAESILDNYIIRLASPALPAFAWKPMVFSIGTVGVFYLAKYLLTI